MKLWKAKPALEKSVPYTCFPGRKAGRKYTSASAR